MATAQRLATEVPGLLRTRQDRRSARRSAESEALFENPEPGDTGRNIWSQARRARQEWRERRYSRLKSG